MPCGMAWSAASMENKNKLSTKQPCTCWNFQRIEGCLSAVAGTPNKGGTEFLPPKCMEKQIKLHFFAIFVDSANNIWYTFFDFERRIVFARVFQSNLPTDRPTGAGRNTDIWNAAAASEKCKLLRKKRSVIRIVWPSIFSTQIALCSRWCGVSGEAGNVSVPTHGHTDSRVHCRSATLVALLIELKAQIL